MHVPLCSFCAFALIQLVAGKTGYLLGDHMRPDVIKGVGAMEKVSCSDRITVEFYKKTGRPYYGYAKVYVKTALACLPGKGSKTDILWLDGSSNKHNVCSTLQLVTLSPLTIRYFFSPDSDRRFGDQKEVDYKTHPNNYI